MDEVHQPPQQHYPYRDELRWLIRQFQSGISESSEAWELIDLDAMSVADLELYLEALKPEHRLEMKRRAQKRAVPLWTVGDLPPRPAYTSPYSGQDIVQRSG